LIYIDTSVALAQLLAEDRFPSPALWQETLVASRLLEYELWTRLNARGLYVSHGDLARELIARVAFLELIDEVVARAREPFPVTVRTLESLHLATVMFLTTQGQRILLATYDDRLAQAAGRLKIPLYPL
jgi:hypothetical protein